MSIIEKLKTLHVWGFVAWDGNISRGYPKRPDWCTAAEDDGGELVRIRDVVKLIESQAPEMAADLANLARMARAQALEEAAQVCENLHALPRHMPEHLGGGWYDEPTYNEMDVDCYPATAARIAHAIRLLKEVQE